VADDRRALQLELREQRREELLVELDQGRPAHLVGAAERRHVERDDAVVAQQPGHHPAPAVRGVAVSVDQQDGRPLAGVDHVGRHAVDVHQPVRQSVSARVVQPRMACPFPHT
jgi:hypothetical protein